MSDPTEKNDLTPQEEDATTEPAVAEADVVAEPLTIDAETVADDDDLVIDAGSDADDDDLVIDSETSATDDDVVIGFEPAAAAASSRPQREVRQPRAPRGPVQYAVIKTGGKQYRVSVGDTIAVERLASEAGNEITLDEVLLIGGDGTTKIGTPVVTGASVSAHVDTHFRGEKLVIFKYKAKKRYRRRTGHRQEQTRLTITAITG